MTAAEAISRGLGARRVMMVCQTSPIQVNWNSSVSATGAGSTLMA